MHFKFVIWNQSDQKWENYQILQSWCLKCIKLTATPFKNPNWCLFDTLTPGWHVEFFLSKKLTKQIYAALQETIATSMILGFQWIFWYFVTLFDLYTSKNSHLQRSESIFKVKWNSTTVIILPNISMILLMEFHFCERWYLKYTSSRPLRILLYLVLLFDWRLSKIGHAFIKLSFFTWNKKGLIKQVLLI